MQEDREGRIARVKGGGPNANGSHVAQKLGETRQNGPYGVFRVPPIPMHTPRHENRATAVLTPLPTIPPSSENPDSPSATETPTDYPIPAARGSIPAQYLERAGGRRSAKTPHAAGLAGGSG